MSLCGQVNQSLVSAKGVVKFSLHCYFNMYNLQSNKYYPECKGANFSTLEYGVSSQTNPFLNQGVVPIVMSFTNVW
jgi:hypothetical protein